MRNSVVAIFLLLTSACTVKLNDNKLHTDQINEGFKSGNFLIADSLINLDKSKQSCTNMMFNYYNVLQAKMQRIELDFSLSEEDIIAQLKKPFPELTQDQLTRWEQSGELEMRLINNKKRYFYYAVNNLYRLNHFASKKRDSLYEPRSDGLSQFRKNEAQQVIERSINHDAPNKNQWHIKFTITVPENTVQKNEMIKCWMPFPRLNHARQNNIKLISVNSEDYILSDTSSLQRSLYIEKPAIDSAPTIFEYEASFETNAEWHDPLSLANTPYNKQSALYLKYTKEQAPQIVFTEAVKNLADSLTMNISDPIDIVKALYYWIDKSITWASALEYSTFDCIPDYVIKYRHGDCGMVTILFMSMARYTGIPVKWQSGWMLHPGYKNLHDWAEVYYEGIGWIPLDMSFGYIQSTDPHLHSYYMTGIDACRLIVNDEISTEFNPPKKFYRSEPYDFQRGEVEWSGGNLYFNQWDYSLQIIHDKLP